MIKDPPQAQSEDPIRPKINEVPQSLGNKPRPASKVEEEKSSPIGSEFEGRPKDAPFNGPILPAKILAKKDNPSSPLPMEKPFKCD